MPVLQPANALHLLVGEVDGLVDPAGGGIEQPQAAERQRGGLPQGVAVDVDELEAAAAEIAGNAVGGAEAHHDALRGQLGLALAGEHLDAGAQRRSPRTMKSGPSVASRQAAVAMARTCS